MAFSDYSTNPAENVTIGGLYIGPNAPPGNVDNVCRQLASDGKALSLTIPDTSTFMPKSGGVFTGNITRTGRGAFLHHAGPTLVDGRVIFLAEGSPRPSDPAEGTLVFYTS